MSAAACRGSQPSHAGIAGPTLVARLEHTFTGHSGILRQVAFSPDSQLLATSSAEGTVKLWRVADRALVKTLTHPAGVTSVAFSRDGQWLVTGSYDQIVRIIVETPRKLSARQRALLEEFARLAGEEVHPLAKSFLEKVKSMLG